MVQQVFGAVARTTFNPSLGYSDSEPLLLPPLEFGNKTSDNGEVHSTRVVRPLNRIVGVGIWDGWLSQCLQTQRELPTQPHEHLSPTQPHSQEQCGVYASSFFPLTSESCHGSGGSVCSGGRFSARGQFRIDRERVPGPNSWRDARSCRTRFRVATSPSSKG